MNEVKRTATSVARYLVGISTVVEGLDMQGSWIVAHLLLEDGSGRHAVI